MTQAEILVDAKRLYRKFGKFTAVADVDIVLRKGEVFGLLGANGAGKTTAIRMLCGLLSPTAGHIQVAGVDMVRHARYARQKIGYVAQGFALYGDLRVMENLQMQAGLYGLRGKQKASRIAWAVEQLDLSAVVSTYAQELPLGYQRRLSFAASLLHQPPVLFLDEPTSGVDALGRQDFWELIYQLAEQGMGILVTTHYMDEAVFCDRLSLMHASRIIKQGTPRSLLSEKLDAAILHLQSDQSDKLSPMLREFDSIAEIIPHAGGLRLTLKAGADVSAFKENVQAIATANGVEILSLEEVPPLLEDIFVQTLANVNEATAA